MNSKPIQLMVLIWAGQAGAQQSAVQIPAVIQQQVNEIQDRFQTVLDEDCPNSECFSVGCAVSNFLTLDESSTASLPGLGEEPAKGAPQYKLTSVVCEFTHEPKLSEEQVNAIRQRLRQKVKKVGVTVNIRSRALQPRVDPAELAEPKQPELPDPTQLPWYLGLWATMLPFIPWLTSALVATLVFLAGIWGIRRLGRNDRRDPRSRTRASDVVTGGSNLPAEAEPTPLMLIARINQLKAEMQQDTKLVELTLKKHLEDKNFDELCLFLRHFGPELLLPLKDRAEFKEFLTELSKQFSERDFDSEANSEIWKFLSRVERSLVAAKVRIESQPLEDEFGLLASIDVDEFLGLIREVTEAEALAAVAYAPSRLREKFFAHANPTFTAKFVEHLTRVDRMPDHFVRGVARKLRQIYMDKGDALRTIRFDRVPLLEQALNAMEPEQRKALVAGLGKESPGVLTSLAPVIFLDDSLPMLGDDILTEAFLSLSPQESGNYLASFEWGLKVLKRLNPRLQDAITPYYSPKAVNTNYVQAARKKMATFVKSQDQRGVIDLRTLNSTLIGKLG
jgi:flagellar motor switch protein FliG